jgi:hypothetical protein
MDPRDPGGREAGDQSPGAFSHLLDNCGVVRSLAVLHGDRGRHRLHFHGIVLAEHFRPEGLSDVVSVVESGLLLLCGGHGNADVSTS